MYKKLKRVLDFIFAFILIIVFAPIFIIVSIIILTVMGSPIFFKQERIGMNNKSFMIIKFRSMLKISSSKDTDSMRITPLGKALRALHIDELPQLFNILLGHMSFVGPRPLLPEYLPYYTEDELKRHSVRPGLSGLSQIEVLHYPKWEEQFKYDIIYVDNLSFKLDLIIFFKTIKKALTPINKLSHNYPNRLKFNIYRQKQMEENN